MTSSADVIDSLAGIEPGSPVAALRQRRPDFVRYTQGSHDVLLAPADPAGISLAERALVALRVATLERSDALAEHYRARLRDVLGGDETPAVGTPRLQALLDHVERVTTAPRTATKAQLDALRALGFSARDLVTIAQLVAFVSYQGRVAAGLRLLVEESRA
jgi:uncharacterized protein YciW